jgi:hypothetical protein
MISLPAPVLPAVAALPASPDVPPSDESSDLPDWLPGLARALLDRVVLDRTADAPLLAASSDPSSGILFPGEDSAARLEAVHDPQDEQVP